MLLLLHPNKEACQSAAASASVWAAEPLSQVDTAHLAEILQGPTGMHKEQEQPPLGMLTWPRAS
jgi:hypothetical protein